ncbi:uncharacterized protein LOC119111439 [Pollicipes pollicipes]|uniref:uncharacterized protein LOC119111439 n=1 Tax=Pollicipes pollicipes TaxID=41117 RepID=UPI001884CAD7|nr:uncharacterized protein LOC119111439 [Pollicipes pollicipes]
MPAADDCSGEARPPPGDGRVPPLKLPTDVLHVTPETKTALPEGAYRPAVRRQLSLETELLELLHDFRNNKYTLSEINAIALSWTTRKDFKEAIRQDNERRMRERNKHQKQDYLGLFSKLFNIMTPSKRKTKQGCPTSATYQEHKVKKCYRQYCPMPRKATFQSYHQHLAKNPPPEPRGVPLTPKTLASADADATTTTLRFVSAASATATATVVAHTAETAPSPTHSADLESMVLNTPPILVPPLVSGRPDWGWKRDGAPAARRSPPPLPVRRPIKRP